MNKYGARKVSLGGQTFDSEREFNRWCELSLLQRGKAISDLKRQVKFELIPTQRNEYGQLIAAKYPALAGGDDVEAWRTANEEAVREYVREAKYEV